MTSKQVAKFIAALEDAGSEEVRTNYSGRGMFGATCVGVEVASQKDATELIVDVLIEARSDDDREAFGSILKRGVFDSMGLGLIFYFPGVTVEE